MERTTKDNNPTVYMCGWNRSVKYVDGKPVEQKTKSGQPKYKPFAKAFENRMSKDTFREYAGLKELDLNDNSIILKLFSLIWSNMV